METKEFKEETIGESNPLTNEPKVKKFYLDDLIDNIEFSRYHLSIIFICLLTNVNDGYFSLYFKFNENTFLNKLTWTKFDYSSIMVGQNVLFGLGAILSVYARTSYWDVSSNSLIAIIEFLSSLMLLTYSDTLIYKITLVFYCFCQGYLSNLSTNYLLEISHRRIRGGLFVFVCGFRFLGQAIFGLVTMCVSNSNKTSDPNILIVGLVISSAFLSIACLYLVDSPRVLFYNNDTVILIHFLKDLAKDEEIFDFDKQKQIQQDLDKYKVEINEYYQTQEIRGHLHEYPDLFSAPIRCITIKGLIFSFLCILLITNVTDIYPYLLKDNKSFDDFIYYKVGYELMLYKFTLFIWFGSIALFLFYVEVRMIVLTVTSLVACLIIMILILLLKTHFTLLILIYEAFSFLFYFLIYLHYSEYTTTRLRNSFTSLFYFTFSMAYIVQFFCIETLTKINTILPIYINLAICSLLIILDFSLNSYTTSDKGLNEIELAIYEKKLQ